jgi:hypothetical protein
LTSRWHIHLFSVHVHLWNGIFSGESVMFLWILCTHTEAIWRVLAFWYMTPCSLTEVYRYFGGTYCLRIQGRRESNKEPESRALASIMRMNDAPPKRKKTFTRLHGVTSSKLSLPFLRFYTNFTYKVVLLPTRVTIKQNEIHPKFGEIRWKSASWTHRTYPLRVYCIYTLCQEGKQLKLSQCRFMGQANGRHSWTVY